ncbi:putative Ras-related protein Rab-33 [Apostichopus japonicus]|uniref:putative Ras-related protein Rab-33 n=1 Tax=Stichopus japonicus TaxID=307972 RepID=UPI003AB8B197
MEGSKNTTGTILEEGESSTASQESPSQRRIFKVIVLGDSNVGKTCLTIRFCGGDFPQKPEATIGVDFRDKDVTVDGESIKLQLWDTAGQERFRKSMVQHYYRNVHAVIFVYDVTKLSSFENLPTWVDECDRHSLSSNVPRVLVANKCDITDRRVVSTNMGQKFAEHNDMPFFETSAKSSEVGESVSNIFLYIAKKLKAQRPHLHLRAGLGGISGSGRTSVRKLRLKSSGLRGFEPEKTPKSKCAGGCFS